MPPLPHHKLVASRNATWTAALPDPVDCLGPTEILDLDSPAVQAIAASVPDGPPAQIAAAAFEAVRDGVRYNFAPDLETRDDWRASATLARGNGFCQQKAVVLAAVLRARGIPAALGYQDLFDDKVRPPYSDMLGGKVLRWHGMVLAHVDGRWLVADASLDRGLCEKRGYRLAEWVDGEGAPLPETDHEGHLHFQVRRDIEAAVDLPAAAVAGVMDQHVIHGEAWKTLVRSRGASM